jgi:hypothetical protein
MHGGVDPKCARVERRNWSAPLRRRKRSWIFLHASHRLRWARQQMCVVELIQSQLREMKRELQAETKNRERVELELSQARAHAETLSKWVARSQLYVCTRCSTLHARVYFGFCWSQHASRGTWKNVGHTACAHLKERTVPSICSPHCRRGLAG